jgi:hypothetical protein
VTNRFAAPAARWATVLIAVAGLAVDAYVHFDLAGTYDAITTGTLSQGDLFRAEAVAAIVAGVAVLVRPRRYTAAFAAFVAGSGFAAVMVYRYYDIGKLGPIPSMYEPVWYPEKSQAAWAEAIATAAAIALLILLHVRARTAKPSPSRDRVASNG